MTYMTNELLLKLRKVFDNPAEYFIDYPVSLQLSDEQQKKFDAMSDAEKKAFEQMPEEYRIQIRPEFIGLTNSLSIVSDLAYEIANSVPNNKDKEIAIGLLQSVCDFLVKACKPEDKDE